MTTKDLRKEVIPYKDTNAAPGSQLHAALLAKDEKLAAKIHQETSDRHKALIANIDRNLGICK